MKFLNYLIFIILLAMCIYLEFLLFLEHIVALKYHHKYDYNLFNHLFSILKCSMFYKFLIQLIYIIYFQPLKLILRNFFEKYHFISAVKNYQALAIILDGKQHLMQVQLSYFNFKLKINYFKFLEFYNLKILLLIFINLLKYLNGFYYL